MTERGALSDAAFERALFDSAKQDAPSPEAKLVAWQQLAHATALVATGGAAAGAARGFSGAAFSKGAALLTSGIVVGSALTFALLRGSEWAVSERAAALATDSATASLSGEALLPQPRRGNGEPAPPPGASSAVGSSAVGSSAVASSAVGSSAVGSGAVTAPSSERPAAPTSAVPSKGAARAQGGSVQPPAANASTLPQEIAALDRVRTALSARDYGSVLERVRLFQGAFPASPLLPDVEALAAEALRGSGNVSASRDKAKAFLRRYPKDPHAERMRELARE